MTASSGTSKSAWIHADQAKGGKAIPVPLNSEALAVVREQIGRNQTVVFTFDGRPILQPNTKAWRKALVRAGIDDFRWHDLRHTWASWHVQAGTPLHISCENWAVGRPRPWSAATRIWRQNTSPNTRSESHGLHQICTTAKLIAIR